jgi:trehalose/maltose hydrolase-like predicted phosphorylase
LVGKPEKKRPFGRPQHKWESNIRIDLGDIVWEGVDWIHMGQDREQWQALVNTVMNLQVRAGNFF